MEAISCAVRCGTALLGDATDHIVVPVAQITAEIAEVTQLGIMAQFMRISFCVQVGFVVGTLGGRVVAWTPGVQS